MFLQISSVWPDIKKPDTGYKKDRIQDIKRPNTRLKKTDTRYKKAGYQKYKSRILDIKRPDTRYQKGRILNHRKAGIQI